MRRHDLEVGEWPFRVQCGAEYGKVQSPHELVGTTSCSNRNSTVSVSVTGKTKQRLCHIYGSRRQEGRGCNTSQLSMRELVLARSLQKTMIPRHIAGQPTVLVILASRVGHVIPFELDSVESSVLMADRSISMPHPSGRFCKQSKSQVGQVHVTLPRHASGSSRCVKLSISTGCDVNVSTGFHS